MQQEKYKPLIHDTQPGFAVQGVDGVWSNFGSFIYPFIKNIKTRTLDLKADVGTIVSGVPTVFARTTLFRLAIDQGESSADDQNLSAFYASLLCEWKGFITCIALEGEQIDVQRIYMQYSDEKDAKDTNNIYEPKGAFGNMLFTRKQLWSEQGETEYGGIPFVDIIKYKNKVVGGTSPESLLFTSVAYKIDLKGEKKPFIDSSTGKFIDPLDSSFEHSQLNAEQTARLHAYLTYLSGNVSMLEKYYSTVDDKSLVSDFSKYISILDRWKTELENYARSKQYSTEASIPTVTCFKNAPYDTFFNHSDALYGKGGLVYDHPVEGCIVFRPKDLLLPEDDTEMARLSLTGISQDDVSGYPAFYLAAELKDNPAQHELFALPLSPIGLKVFGGKNLGTFLDPNGAGSTMNAVYSIDDDELQVTISLKLSESQRPSIPVSVKYKVSKKSVRGKEIIIWPNFKAKNWTRYFLYSEIPHNMPASEMSPFKAVPFVGDRKEEIQGNQGERDEDPFKIIENPDRMDISEPWYLAENGSVCVPEQSDDDKLKAKLLVYCSQEVSLNPYKYEIYESNMPFKGVKLMTGANKNAGFLIIKYEENPTEGRTVATDYYQKRLSDASNLKSVTLGIDFGSTNSSIAYRLGDDNPNDFVLKNHRISLLPQKKANLVKENEILFFQAKDIPSNAIRSILTLHEPHRIKRERTENSESITYAKDIKGGFPCAETNLPITSVGDNTIVLQFKDVKTQNIALSLTQCYNMKWGEDNMTQAHMAAFLKSLLLQVYADLFSMFKGEKALVPEKVNWAYPAAMPDSLVSDYFTGVWNKLTELIIPVKNCSISIGKYDPGEEDSISLNQDFDSPSSGMDDMSGGMGGMSGGMGGMSGGMGGMSGGMGGMSGGMGGMSGGMGGMSGGMGGMSGGIGGMSGGMDDMSSGESGQRGQIDIRPSTEPTRFNFRDLTSAGALSEACAVANYISHAGNTYEANETDKLNLCFDIGGSTSDISVLCMMKDVSFKTEISMVKQSSIRFAAQRVTNATKYCKSLKDVLLGVCANFASQPFDEFSTLQQRIKESYTSDTAPYFFEQIVNILNKDQLTVFYGQIRSQCPELMSVNLYVTGLIMFYAGQLARKVIEDIKKNPEESDLDDRPKVYINFVGKGSRIFEWFVSTDQGVANGYYNQLFLKGMGGIEIARTLINDFYILYSSNKIEVLNNVKYEVSKGLAQLNTNHESSEVTTSSGGMGRNNSADAGKNVDMMVPTNKSANLELVGESSFEVRYENERIPIKSTDTITPEMMQYLGTKFTLSRDYDNNPCPEFWKFIDSFGAYAIKYFHLKMTPQEFVNSCRNLGIVSYIKNQPEYKKASGNSKKNKFDYVAPIIILEGMKFYDDTLLKVIKR